MDANDCNNHLDGNQYDTDVLLPPRKRLLAGYKKQSSESPSPSPSPSQCNHENLPSCHLNEFDARLSILLKTYKNGSKLSPEEIAEAAGSAAAAASEAAHTAKAAAEEKAALAAKAVAAAKSALHLVASISVEAGSKDKNSKKNKLKKHVPVQLLYKKYQPVENCQEDEELARKLHHAMNSSPRISKHSPDSDGNSQRMSKKSKRSPSDGKSVVQNGKRMKEGKLPYMKDGDAVGGEMDSEQSDEASYTVKVDDSASKSSKSDRMEAYKMEAESSHSKERIVGNDICSIGRKRGRVKQKKLPLSICSFKDQVNPKEDLTSSCWMLARAPVDKSSGNDISFSEMTPAAPPDGHVSVARAPTWKCQDLKVPNCIEQNKVVQS